MTPKLQQLIQTTAETIVQDVDECLLSTPKIKRTKAHLEKFAGEIEKELTPQPPAT